MRKCCFITFLSVFLYSCFSFENPVDPASSHYVGFPVEKGISLAEFSQADYGVLNYPSLAWTSIANSLYYLHISKNRDFAVTSDDYQGVFSHSELAARDSFDPQAGWFIQYRSQYLDSLGAGSYYVRVSVSNAHTGNRFRTWSRTSVFQQKLKQIKAGWEDQSGYILYSYTNDGCYKKADSYYLFISPDSNQSEIRYSETVVYAYQPDGTLQYEWVYRSPNAEPNHYLFHYYYHVQIFPDSNTAAHRHIRINRYCIKDLKIATTTERNALDSVELRHLEDGRLKNIEYFVSQPGIDKVDDSNMSDEEFLSRFFYVGKERFYRYDEFGHLTSILENHYKLNQEKKEILSYFIFYVDGNAIYRGEYYTAGESDYIYLYDISYYDRENRYPEKAVYTYRDGSSRPDYLYQYNFSTVMLTESSNIEIGFTQNRTSAFIPEKSDLPEVPVSDFVF